MREPKWLGEAARLLASGVSVTDAARSCGITREALSRRWHAPGSSLAAAVERQRGQLATEPAADKNAALLQQALDVLAQGLKGSDPKRAYDAAKVLLAKLAPTTTTVKIEAPVEVAITPTEAVHQLAHALADAVHLVAGGDVSSEAVAELTAAASRLVAVLPPASLPELVTGTTGAGAAPADADANRPHLLQ